MALLQADLRTEFAYPDSAVGIARLSRFRPRMAVADVVVVFVTKSISVDVLTSVTTDMSVTVVGKIFVCVTFTKEGVCPSSAVQKPCSLEEVMTL